MSRAVALYSPRIMRGIAATPEPLSDQPGDRSKAPHLFSSLSQASVMLYCCMKVEEIAEAVAKLPPDQLARFRRWFTAFEAGRANHAEELDSAATKFGRLAGRAFAELKKRAKEP